jgi:hypothetical protein
MLMGAAFPKPGPDSPDADEETGTAQTVERPTAQRQGYVWVPLSEALSSSPAKPDTSEFIVLYGGRGCARFTGTGLTALWHSTWKNQIFAL